MALRIEPNEINPIDELCETQSQDSYLSPARFANNYKSLNLKKQVFQADCFLDMEKLPRKTQTILSKFEMIVIAKVVALNPARESELDIEDVELNLDREEETKEGEK